MFIKIFLIMVLSFNAYSQIKIKITNREGKVKTQTFKTEPEKLAYIARLEHHWGQKHRTQFKPCYKAENEEKQEEITDELIGTRIKYTCKKNYKIEDVPEYAAEMEAKIIERESRNTEIQQIKAALNKINESELPVWHKRLLRRLAKELRISDEG